MAVQASDQWFSPGEPGPQTMVQQLGLRLLINGFSFAEPGLQTMVHQWGLRPLTNGLLVGNLASKEWSSNGGAGL